jgi:hypothetical protein
MVWLCGGLAIGWKRKRTSIKQSKESESEMLREKPRLAREGKGMECDVQVYLDIHPCLKPMANEPIKATEAIQG